MSPEAMHGHEAGAETLERMYEDAARSLERSRREFVRAQSNVRLAEERVATLQKAIMLEALARQDEGALPDRTGAAEPFIDTCVRIVDEHGGSIRLGELKRTLIERGVPIPGKGTDANLVSRLQGSGGRIVNLNRGIYGFPEKAGEGKG